jgi:membrane-associated PAP2 superfamily phosphatase
MTIRNGSKQRFLLYHLGPALLAALVLVALESTPIDSTISGWFFDPVTGGFPLRYNVAFEIATHQWAKLMVVLIGSAVIGAYFLSHIVPALATQRRLLLFLALALTLAPAAVVLLKAGSPRHCPYDLAEYGGYAAHVGLFDTVPSGQDPGHCFPGGHASGGFCLLAFYFAGVALRNRVVAMVGLWGGLAAGMLFGMARVAQGAHFLSHNLWSAVVCWLVALTLYVAIIGASD